MSRESMWPLLGLIVLILLFILREVLVAGKWRRRQFLRQVSTLDSADDGAVVANAARVERATDFWEALARYAYYAISLISALGLITLQFIPLPALHSIYVKLLLGLLAFGGTAILLWYWQGWDEEGERLVRKKLHQAYERDQAKRGMKVRDEVTDLYTREFFLHQVERETRRIIRRPLPLSCLIFEIDGFEHFRSGWGDEEAAGALQIIGLAITNNVRSYDLVCRYGFHQLGIVLLHCKRGDADRVGERVAGNVMALFLEEMNRRYATHLEFIWGSATLPQEAKSPYELLARAERDLESKKCDPQRRVLTTERGKARVEA